MENLNTKTTEKPISLGAAIAAELIIGFWCGVGVILAVKIAQCLENCIEEIISRK